MIHYHGTPITPNSASLSALTGRHGMISYHRPDQLAMAAEVCQSFVIDNGAFSAWKDGGAKVDVPEFLKFVEKWMRHPGFDWCLIPDIIDGDEEDNRKLAETWPAPAWCSVPVWHLHESLEYLDWMMTRWPRIALGSSGQWATPGQATWWDRIAEAMEVAAPNGVPRCKMHGLRMLDPTIFSHLPLASADSCNIARNIGIDSRWDGHMYLRGLSKSVRAEVIAQRIEGHAAASTWDTSRGVQRNFCLLG